MSKIIIITQPNSLVLEGRTLLLSELSKRIKRSWS